MKKIVSDILIVGTQLIVGGLFLWILFSDNNENNQVVVIENDNLNKMADSVSELFTEDKTLTETVESTEVIELPSSEELAKKAQEEEEARKIAEEEERKRQEEEEARRNAVMVSASGYISKPGMGFEVTTDNKTYTLGDGDFNIVAGVVACEASGKDDALAVMSVILNRADNNGISPVNVVAAPGQFSCYNYPGDPSKYSSVVQDALNGIRNNNYTGFRSWASGYSDNYISEGGNRYGR